MIKTINIKKLCLAIGIIAIGAWSPCMAGSTLLEWNTPATGGLPQGYYVYYGKTDSLSSMLKINTNSTATQYRLDNLEDGVQYYFYVSAYNSFGEGPISNAFSKLTTNVPTSLRVVEYTP